MVPRRNRKRDSARSGPSGDYLNRENVAADQGERHTFSQRMKTAGHAKRTHASAPVEAGEPATSKLARKLRRCQTALEKSKLAGCPSCPAGRGICRRQTA